MRRRPRLWVATGGRKCLTREELAKYLGAIQWALLCAHLWGMPKVQYQAMLSEVPMAKVQQWGRLSALWQAWMREMLSGWW
jgi:hypothetical protein